MSGHKITRIYVRDYLGIKEIDLAVGEKGAVAKGPNGSGKTSLLKAISAALAAKGVSPDHIRVGEDSSELLVEIDSNILAKRRITANGNSLTVTKDGFTAKAPQTFLTEMFGSSALDPMDLLLLKPKERRQKILQTLPVKLTIEKLREWWPKCPDNFDVSGHGLEVLENLRGKVYDKRAGANKAAKDAKLEADRLFLIAAQAGASAPSSAPDVETISRTADEARARFDVLKSRREEAEKAEARTKSTRDKAKALFDEGNRILLDLPNEVGESLLAKKRQDVQDQQREVEQLQNDLRVAEELLCNLRLGLKKAEQDNQIRQEKINQAASLQAQSAQIEEALQSAAVEPVTDEELKASESAGRLALAALIHAHEDARKFDEARAAGEAYKAAKERQIAAETEADRLDRFVRVLTEDAPKELLASCDGIPGLSLDGDTIKLDGVSLDTLCGAEQVRFAVEVAKRANAKTKILVVDGLERLDPVAYEEFIRAATADGWQLLASRVDAGELVIESIGQAECSEAAE